MEKSQEFLAKIMNRERDYLISKKIILVGRETNSTFKDDVKDHIYKLIDPSAEFERTNISDDPKVSKIAGLIIFNDKKRLFKYTNLSRNTQLVNNKILAQFESTKLKNKSEICIGTEMFFFIYSKSLLMNYYRQKLERMMKSKDKVSHVGSGNKAFPVHQSHQIAKDHPNQHTNTKVPSQQLKLSSKKKKAKKSNDSNSNFTQNTPYTFDNILNPPIVSNMFSNENENILDDIIESSNKVKIGNSNHKSILINDKENK